MTSIGVLWPAEQTYGWMTGKEVIRQLDIDCEILPEPDQPQLLLEVLEGTSRHAACLVAYSNNLGRYAVSDVWQHITRFARTVNRWKQRLEPNQLIALAQTKIQQCLIGIPGTEFSDIRHIYAHKEWYNQAKQWLDDNIWKGYEVSLSASNGAAINTAIEKEDATVAAIGPSFAAKCQSYVLQKWVDNNPNSETSFALIRNPKKSLQIRRRDRHNGDFGVRLYGKIDPSHCWEVLFSSAITSHGLSPYSLRSTNSPASGLAVIWQDVITDSREKLQILINDMKAGCPNLEVVIRNGDFNQISLSGITWGVPEFNYLWPCPVIRIK